MTFRVAVQICRSCGWAGQIDLLAAHKPRDLQDIVDPVLEARADAHGVLRLVPVDTYMGKGCCDRGLQFRCDLLFVAGKQADRVCVVPGDVPLVDAVQDRAEDDRLLDIDAPPVFTACGKLEIA